MAGKKQVISHLKSDMKMFKKEADEDKELMKSLKNKKKKATIKKVVKKPKAVAKTKISKVMHEFKEGELHSGSKKGPLVKNPKQALAIAISESKRSKKK